MTCRAHVLIHGRVQGVGFRYATCETADRLGLNGWVRNLPDGRVEAVLEGSRALLDEAVLWCGRGPAGARVQAVHTHWEEGEPQFSDFRLTY